MISVLHITQDDKFFDVVKNNFETDKRLSNYSIVVVEKHNYTPKYIKNSANVKFVLKRDLKFFFRSHQYDVVFFHSLPPQSWNAIKYISAESTIIWWGWGWELYEEIYGLRPLINIRLFKPITHQIVYEHSLEFAVKNIIKRSVQAPFHMLERRKVVKKISFFQPVILEDYKQMRKLPFFHARLFYYKNSIAAETLPYNLRPRHSAILIGNSATATNNHLDIINKLEDICIDDRKVIIPFNYGDSWYKDYVGDRIVSSPMNITMIKDFLSRDDYFKLIESCGYAIFGVVRQQAMGNIYHCIRQGIKVFLYKDSLVYKYLKDFGYAVYTIENISKEDLENPLSQSDHEINCRMLKKENAERNSIYETRITELECKYQKCHD